MDISDRCIAPGSWVHEQRPLETRRRASIAAHLHHTEWRRERCFFGGQEIITGFVMSAVTCRGSICHICDRIPRRECENENDAYSATTACWAVLHPCASAPASVAYMVADF